MPFLVQANNDDHTLAVTTESAKEAFSKAVEWHAVYRMSGVIITDDARSYTIDEFSSAMAMDEIAETLLAEKSQKPG